MNLPELYLSNEEKTMKILLASRNKKKIAELHKLMHEYVNDIEILSLDDVGFYDEIVEDGTTFEENAMIKAKTGASLGYICISDDSGLEVDALGGAPGVYSARYAGEGATDEENNRKLQDAIKDVPDDECTARYVCVVACATPDGESFCVREACEGKIIKEYRGNGGFGYDPMFFVEEFGCTFAETTPEQKNSISHRGKAMRVFCQRFLSVFGG